MDWDAKIDEELNALSDVSIEEDEPFESENFIFENDNAETFNDTSETTNWLELFLKKTEEQSRNTENILCEAADVLNEVNENVVQSQMKICTLKTDEDSVHSQENLEDVVVNNELEEEVSSNNIGEIIEENIEENTETSVCENSPVISELFPEKQTEVFDFFDDFDVKKAESDKKILEYELQCNEEITQQINNIESNRLATKKHLEELEKEERKILIELDRQKHFHESERKNKAACLIQSMYRRYAVRKVYGANLDKKLHEAKEKRTQQRVLELEKKQINQRKTFSEVNHVDTNNSNSTRATDSIGSDSNIEKDKNEPDDNKMQEDFNLTTDINKNTAVTSHAEDASSCDFNEKSHDLTVDRNLKESEFQTSAMLQSNIPNEVHDGGTMTAIQQDLAILQKSISLNSVENDKEVTDFKETPSLNESEESSPKNLTVHEALDKDLALLQASVNLKKGLSGEDTAKAPEYKCLHDDALLERNLKIQNPAAVSQDLSCATLSSAVEVTSKQPTKLLDNTKDPSASLFDTIEASSADISDRKHSAVIPIDLKKNLFHSSIDISGDCPSNKDGDEMPFVSCGVNPMPSCSKVVSSGKECISDNALSTSIPEGEFPTGSNAPTAVNDIPNTLPPDLTSVGIDQEIQILPTVVLDDDLKNPPAASSLSRAVSNEGIPAADDQVSNEATTPSVSPSSYFEELVFSSSTASTHVTFLEQSSLTNIGGFADSFVKGQEILHGVPTPNNSSSFTATTDEPKIDIIVKEGELVVKSHEQETIANDENPVKTKSSSSLANETDDENSEQVLFHHSSKESNIADETAVAVDRAEKDDAASISAIDTTFSPAELWQNWKAHCVKWEVKKRDESLKPPVRRTIRKSSAARKLAPLSEEEIINGRWPHYKELSEQRKTDTLSRIYIHGLDGNGRNLVHVHRCVNLTHLTLIKCGLVSLEGLQACPSLRHINVSHNNINILSCDGMKRLESLVASNNRLTSIHGLSACNELLLIDMSYNSITKISGLEGTPNLAHLRLSGNQLLQITGLNVLQTLISLDVSSNNLSSLDGISNCGLIRHINASSNCFTEIPAVNLLNAVLLVHLDLSGNNISQLHFTPHSNSRLFLPSLLYLQLERNKIALGDAEVVLSSIVPQLQVLDLCQNLISNADRLLSSVKQLNGFSKLWLSQNLFSKEQEIAVFDGTRDCDFGVVFSGLNDIELSSPTTNTAVIKSQLILPSVPGQKIQEDDENSELYVKAIIRQTKEYAELLSAEMSEMKRLTGWKYNSKHEMDESSGDVFKLPPALFSCHCDYLKKHVEVAIKQRCTHESSDSALSCRIQAYSRRKNVTKRTEPSPAVDGLAQLIQHSNETYSKYMADNDKVLLEENHLTSSLSHRKTVNSMPDSRENLLRKSTTSTKVVFEQLQRRKIAGVLEKCSAAKIQRCWRRYSESKRRRRKCENHNHAACLIQSAWRGYSVRKNIKSLIVLFDQKDGEMEDDFEEVDLSELEFDENSYEQQWAYKTVFGKAFSPRLPETPTNSALSLGHIRRTTATSPTHGDGTSFRDEIANSQTIWQKVASLSKPPLPPITPTGSSTNSENMGISEYDRVPSAIPDSHRSKHSRKEEELTHEWGLHSSSATQLMLKRARRMKGRRKKEITAEEKLKRFQELQQRISQQPLKTHQKPIHNQRRIDYFKAREMQFEEEEEKKKSPDLDEQRYQYTYEWLHTSASISEVDAVSSRGNHPLPPQKRKNSLNSSSKSGFLPPISQHRFNHNDIEIVSLSSYNSSRSRNKQLLKDIARRHGDMDVNSGGKR